MSKDVNNGIEAFDAALAAILPLPKKLKAAEPEDEVLIATGMNREGRYRRRLCQMFRGGVCVPIENYEYAVEHFPGVKFYFGNGPSPKTRAIICQVDEQIVGVIMPVRPFSKTDQTAAKAGAE